MSIWNLFIHITMSINLECVLSFKCLDWTSSLDGKYRSHCYEYHQEAYISTFEAEKMCKNTSGQLAPYIDEFQYEFWETFLQIPNRYNIYIRKPIKFNSKMVRKIFISLLRVSEIVHVSCYIDLVSLYTELIISL